MHLHGAGPCCPSSTVDRDVVTHGFIVAPRGGGSPPAVEPLRVDAEGFTLHRGKSSPGVATVAAGRPHRQRVGAPVAEVWAMLFRTILVRSGLTVALTSIVAVPLAFASTPAGAATTTTTRTAVASWTPTGPGTPNVSLTEQYVTELEPPPPPKKQQQINHSDPLGLLVDAYLNEAQGIVTIIDRDTGRGASFRGGAGADGTPYRNNWNEEMRPRLGPLPRGDYDILNRMQGGNPNLDG